MLIINCLINHKSFLLTNVDFQLVVIYFYNCSIYLLFIIICIYNKFLLFIIICIYNKFLLFIIIWVRLGLGV